VTPIVLPAAAGALCFALLDGLWLGFVMAGYYRAQLAAIGRIDGGRFAPDWSAALLVYVLLGLGLALFAVPRATSVGSAAAYGALFGLIVYGVYDFTNVATLRQYPLQLALVDVAWGAAASALGTMVAWMTAR
jgi:uncharacterized membrane protein